MPLPLLTRVFPRRRNRAPLSRQRKAIHTSLRSTAVRVALLRAQNLHSSGSGCLPDLWDEIVKSIEGNPIMVLNAVCGAHLESNHAGIPAVSRLDLSLGSDVVCPEPDCESDGLLTVWRLHRSAHRVRVPIAFACPGGDSSRAQRHPGRSPTSLSQRGPRPSPNPVSSPRLRGHSEAMRTLTRPCLLIPASARPEVSRWSSGRWNHYPLKWILAERSAKGQFQRWTDWQARPPRAFAPATQEFSHHPSEKDYSYG